MTERRLLDPSGREFVPGQLEHHARRMEDTIYDSDSVTQPEHDEFDLDIDGLILEELEALSETKSLD